VNAADEPSVTTETGRRAVGHHRRHSPAQRFVNSAGCVGFKNSADFITHTPKNGMAEFFIAGRLSRVIEWEMVAVGLAGKDWARFIGLAADGDDGLDSLVEKFVEMFRSMPGNVDPNLRQNLDGERMHEASRLRAGAGDTKLFTQRCPQNSLGELRATTVSRAQNENER
jgi:hypothetical protein